MNFKKAVLLVGIIYFCFVLFYTSFQLLSPVKIKQDVEVYIPKGKSFSEIAKILKEKGLIRDEMLFILLGRIMGIDKKARAGYYIFTKDMTAKDVIEKLMEGKIIEYTVTVVEGDSLYEISDKLSAQNLIPQERFWELVKDKKFLKSLNIDAPSLEGYLFPDTYKIPKGMDAEEILATMVKRFWEVYDAKLREKTKKMGWSINQVVTLASIIEKEAKVDEERPIISAVYHNRLRFGMPLQADPTAIYGIKRFSAGVTKKDLQNKTPYNTYVIKGLPPGPIASPGLKSIIAALNPAKVSYLYFVSRGDGTHEFSVDYESHLIKINEIKTLQ